MGKNNIIEINGRRYNASTGEPLSGSIAHAGAVPPGSVATTAMPVHIPAKAIPIHDAANSKPAPKPNPVATSASKARLHEAIKARPQSRPQQHSKTLRRDSVTKPGHSLKRHTKAQSHTDSLVDKPSARLQPKASVRRLDNRRLALAKNTPKSQAVNRFSKQPVGPPPQPPLHIPQPTHKPHGGPVHHPASPPKPPKHAPTTADILERALQNATSHQETFSAPKRRRLPSPAASVTMVVAALVILGGFVAYQNITNIKVHLASSKAGFTASLPDYQPAGYHLSHLNSTPGEVAFNFQSNTDRRSYAITEKTSDWDSDALRDGFLATSGQNYQSVQTAGQTVYLYGQNAATWVTGGVWYQVSSNGGLSDRQLVQLAASL